MRRGKGVSMGPVVLETETCANWVWRGLRGDGVGCCSGRILPAGVCV